MNTLLLDRRPLRYSPLVGLPFRPKRPRRGPFLYVAAALLALGWLKTAYQIHNEGLGALSLVKQGAFLGAAALGAWAVYGVIAWLYRRNRPGVLVLFFSSLFLALGLEVFLERVYASLPIPSGAYLRFSPNAARFY